MGASPAPKSLSGRLLGALADWQLRRADREVPRLLARYERLVTDKRLRAVSAALAGKAEELP
jgi:hypothetical protein